MNVIAGRGKAPRGHPVFYPAADQQDVPLNFPSGGEEPNPIPVDNNGRAGYPVTAFFANDKAPKDASGKLTDANGDEVPCWFSSQEKLANAKFANLQGNTICLIPQEPLHPHTTYRVQMQGELAGKAWEKKWSFKTGESGISKLQATRLVLERLNQARAHAGLGSVVNDEKLSQACQLHADFLVKNADSMLRQKASVNDEDPLLPGFTAEGVRAARRSDVFTDVPVPTMQIDDLLATFTRRVYLLDPNLQSVGFGCADDVAGLALRSGSPWRSRRWACDPLSGTQSRECALDQRGAHRGSQGCRAWLPDYRDFPQAGKPPKHPGFAYGRQGQEGGRSLDLLTRKAAEGQNAPQHDRPAPAGTPACGKSILDHRVCHRQRQRMAAILAIHNGREGTVITSRVTKRKRKRLPAPTVPHAFGSFLRRQILLLLVWKIPVDKAIRSSLM